MRWAAAGDRREMVHFKGQARQADLLNYTKVMGLQGYSVDLINAWKVPCLGDHHARRITGTSRDDLNDTATENGLS